MCGIIGIFSYRQDEDPVSTETLIRARDSMISRGPDGCGEWIAPDQSIGLAHRRLSIIDLSDAGSQPMHSVHNEAIIVYNGELYNYQELRSELISVGYAFKSSSDTEVLLNAYLEYGERVVDKLRGMYAFAIWDNRRNGLFIARDPFGIKPLYFSDDGKVLYFASQIKALCAIDAIKKDPDPAGHVAFFAWGNIPQPLTLYKNIKSIDAGTTYWFGKDGTKKSQKFFDLAQRISAASAGNNPLSSSDRSDYFESVMLDTVKKHLVSDVPIGVFQSAGIDSSLITACATTSLKSMVRTLTLGFKEYTGTPLDETAGALAIGNQYKTDHTTIWYDKEDFTCCYDHLMSHMDQPSIDGVNSYFICKAAADAGLKVVLSGLGGDEFFCGYSNYNEIPALVKSLHPFTRFPMFNQALRHLTCPFLNQGPRYKYSGILEYGNSYSRAYQLRRGLFMPWELADIFDRDILKSGLDGLNEILPDEALLDTIPNPTLKIMYLELTRYMRDRLFVDSDWASMAHSVELRVPFVDIAVFDAVLSAFASNQPFLKNNFESFKKLSLPTQIFQRQKSGFNIPIQQWLLKAEKLKKNKRYTYKNWAHSVYSKKAGTILSKHTN